MKVTWAWLVSAALHGLVLGLPVQTTPVVRDWTRVVPVLLVERAFQTPRGQDPSIESEPVLPSSPPVSVAADPEPDRTPSRDRPRTQGQGAEVRAERVSSSREKDTRPTISASERERRPSSAAWARRLNDDTVDAYPGSSSAVWSRPEAQSLSSPKDLEIPYDPPRFARRVPPAYPRNARRRGIEGDVLLRLTIDASGYLKNIEVVKSSGSEFLEAALIAMRSSTFHPAVRGGKAVASHVLLPIQFRLKD
jgi:TonB family protein